MTGTPIRSMHKKNPHSKSSIPHAAFFILNKWHIMKWLSLFHHLYDILTASSMHLVGRPPPLNTPHKSTKTPINRGFQPQNTPFKVALKVSVSYTYPHFLARFYPSTYPLRARVLNIHLWRNEYPVWISTWISTPHFSLILDPGSGKVRDSDPPPFNAIRTPFKRGLGNSPTDPQNAYR